MRQGVGVVAIFFVASLAGCSGVEEIPGGADDGLDSVDDSETPLNRTGNLAPNATLSVTNTTVSLGVPLDFVLNGTDADGDNLTWILILGDGSENRTGNMLPALVNHTYDAVGVYNVTFTVDDGNSNSTVATQIEVVGEVVEAVPFPEDLVFTGHSSSSEVVTLEFLLESDAVSKAVFAMSYDEVVGPVPEVDNDLDWDISGPGGQGGGDATYGAEAPVSVNGPNAGKWTIELDVYSVFPVFGVDWTVTVTFT